MFCDSVCKSPQSRCLSFLSTSEPKMTINFPAYPSGRWEGYWEQTHFGRQLMHDLELHFHLCDVEGHGHDIVGPFMIHGRYNDSGLIAFQKQYIGQHSVTYRGQYDGEGTIFGEWLIDGIDSGPFALRCEKFTVSADAPILDIGGHPK